MSLQPSSLHDLLEHRNWEQAKHYLADNPDSAYELGTTFKALPLTIALMYQPPLSLVKRLIAANPSKCGTALVRLYMP